MMTGDGGVEGTDLFIKAFGEASVGVANSEPDLIHHRSPSMGTADGRLSTPTRVARACGFRAA
jgi:hypothetical protein